MTEIWRILEHTLPAVQSYFYVIAAFLIAERLIPAERGQAVRSRLLSGGCTLVYFLLTPFALILPSALAAGVAETTGGSFLTLNLDQIHAGWPLATWALRNLLLPFLPMLVFDFFYYWHHRLQHIVPALWEQHKLHHMDETLCCLTNLRHHWLEDAIRVFTITIPMAFLVTMTPVEGAWIALFIAQWAVFIHANVRIPLGPLTPILAGPQLHRIHHSREARHGNRNFAAFFPVWDIVFGTYYRPKPQEWPATGLESGERITNLWDAVVLPFRGWRRMALRSRALTRPFGPPSPGGRG